MREQANLSFLILFLLILVVCATGRILFGYSLRQYPLQSSVLGVTGINGDKEYIWLGCLEQQAKRTTRNIRLMVM